MKKYEGQEIAVFWGEEPITVHELTNHDPEQVVTPLTYYLKRFGKYYFRNNTFTIIIEPEDDEQKIFLESLKYGDTATVNYETTTN